MQNWAEGYLTEIDYTNSYYKELAPNHQLLCAMSRGYMTPLPDAPFTWCEIGCGNGLNANVIAASYPYAQCFAFDFNPNHIMNARSLAQEAGLTNITFYDDNFEQFSQRDLPLMDFIVLHGIYSWVSDLHREQIHQIIQRFLKVGGVVYISYNCLPGWAAKAPLRYLMKQKEMHSSGSVFDKLDHSLHFLNRVKEAHFKYIDSNEVTLKMLNDLQKGDKRYLVHEYCNENWAPFYSNKVAENLFNIKCEYIATATIHENLEDAIFDPTMMTLIEEEKNSSMRELLKDYAKNQQFRRDLFVRGKQKLSSINVVDLLKHVQFALVRPLSECRYTGEFEIGELNLPEAAYKPILEALSSGIKSLGELCQITQENAQKTLRAMVLLKSIGHVEFMWRSETVRKEHIQSARQFNEVVLNRAQTGSFNMVLIAPLLRCGVSVASNIELFFIASYMNTMSNTMKFSKKSDAISLAHDVMQVLARLGMRLTKNNQKLQTDEEILLELKEQENNFLTIKLPLLKMLGIVD